MRFRRETGDFSIKLEMSMSGINDVQLPKGLGAEDLIGVIVNLDNLGVNTYAPISIVNDGVYYLEVIILTPANPAAMYYDPSTGILSATKPPVLLIATEHEESTGEPMFVGIADTIFEGDAMKLAVNVEGSSVPVGVYEGTVTRSTLMPQNYTATWDGKSAVIPKGSGSFGITFSVNGVDKTVDLYRLENSDRLGHPAYVGQRQTI